MRCFNKRNSCLAIWKTTQGKDLQSTSHLEFFSRVLKGNQMVQWLVRKSQAWHGRVIIFATLCNYWWETVVINFYIIELLLHMEETMEHLLLWTIKTAIVGRQPLWCHWGFCLLYLLIAWSSILVTFKIHCSLHVFRES